MKQHRTNQRRANRRRGCHATLLLNVVLCVAVSVATLARADTTTELSAGLVVFAAAGLVATDAETITLSREAVNVTTTLQTTDNREHDISMAFALPDIDMAVLDGAIVSVLGYDANNPANFIGFWARVDGKPVSISVEQRALALGLLDVTALLQRHAIPLYPLTVDVADTLTALPPDTRNDLATKGVAHFNDGQFEPLWTLKTLFHWRQRLLATKPIKLNYGYRPVSGSSPWTADTAASLTERFCVDPTTASDLTRRVETGIAVTAQWVHFQPGTAGHVRGPVGTIAFTIEKPSVNTLVSTCRDTFRANAEGSLEFKANNHLIEDDVLVAFID
jgi:hypothetical protein